MSDFLTRLAARSLGVGELVRPRPVSLFEPRAAQPPLELDGDEIAAEPPTVAARQARPAREAPRPTTPGHVQLRGSEPQSPPRALEPTPAPEAAEPEKNALAPAPVAPAPADIVVAVQAARAEAAEPPADPAREARSPHPVTPVPARTSAPGRVRLRGSEPQSLRASDPPAALRRDPDEPSAEPWLMPPPPTPAVLPPPPAPAETEPPVVRVTIGRVDVRAVLPPTPTEQPKPRRRPRLTLEEYLRDGSPR